MAAGLQSSGLSTSLEAQIVLNAGTLEKVSSHAPPTPPDFCSIVLYCSALKRLQRLKKKAMRLVLVCLEPDKSTLIVDPSNHFQSWEVGLRTVQSMKGQG